MFLKQVKVKAFSESVKQHRVAPWSNTNIKRNTRVLSKQLNKKPDTIFWVVGKTKIQEGHSEYRGYEEGYAWEQHASYTVYLVANTLGRRYKVLAEDLIFVEGETYEGSH